MHKSYNVGYSISLLKAKKKIYKDPLYQVAAKTVKYYDEIKELEDKEYAETCAYLDEEFAKYDNK